MILLLTPDKLEESKLLAMFNSLVMTACDLLTPDQLRGFEAAGSVEDQLAEEAVCGGSLTGGVLL